jgi:hypothetical protein
LLGTDPDADGNSVTNADGNPDTHTYSNTDVDTYGNTDTVGMLMGERRGDDIFIAGQCGDKRRRESVFVRRSKCQCDRCDLVEV